MAIKRLNFRGCPNARTSAQPIPIKKPAASAAQRADGVQMGSASWRQLASSGLSLHQEVLAASRRLAPLLDLDAERECGGSAGGAGNEKCMMAEVLDCPREFVPVVEQLESDKVTFKSLSGA